MVEDGSWPSRLWDSGPTLQLSPCLASNPIDAIRTYVDGQSGNNKWHPQQIRLLDGTSCCCIMTESDDGPEEGSDRERSGEQRFQVLAAEATEDASGEPLLVLSTDQGRFELSPPGRNDRDSMLIGFELLLASFCGAGDDDGGGDGVDGFRKLFEGEGGSAEGGSRDRSVARRRSRRWQGAGAAGGSGGMELASADDGSGSDGRQHQHRG